MKRLQFHVLLATGIACVALYASTATAQETPEAAIRAEAFKLPNGMEFILVPRPGASTIEAGWVVASGSAQDPNGQEGAAHVLEHMLFKGTPAVGSRDARSESSLRLEIDRLLSQLRDAEQKKSDKPKAEKLARVLAQTSRQADSLSFEGAFSLEYARVGATRLNANTAEDFTLFYVTLSPETLELWFWLESDRLREPWFRFFDKEKEIIAEERRLRIESTATGSADLQAREAFWADTAYSHPPMGYETATRALSTLDLKSLFRSNYRPENLSAVLVGDLEPERVRRLAERYFGDLPQTAAQADGAEAASPESGDDPSGHRPRGRSGELNLDCSCPSQVRVQYPGPSFGHPDQAPIELMAGLLNGRSGRLYNRLVLDEGLAFAAYLQQQPLRDGGSLLLTLEAKDEAKPEALLALWRAEVARLQEEPVSQEELLRTARRMETEHLIALKDPHLLMRRLLAYSGLGDWRRLLSWSQSLSLVGPADVQRVAREYLSIEPLVVTYNRTGERGNQEGDIR